MKPSLEARSVLGPVLRVLAALGAGIAVLLAATVIFSNQLRGPLLRYAAANYQRPIRVDGTFEVHLLSRHPRIVAERVSIGNPTWIPTGTAAEIGHLSITYDWPGWGRSWALRRLEMTDATFNLLRDQAGRANWQGRNPDNGAGSGPPLIYGLWMPGARVHLDDRHRRLEFDGTVSAQDAQVTGAGKLNGREVSFSLRGDALATVAHERPYRFEFAERSSGSELNLHGVVPQPFDFRYVEANFVATGDDLRDLYFLTGVTLVDTGQYHLSGNYKRQDELFDFNDLELTTGRSDVRGKLSIISRGSAAPHLDIDLRSQRLRVADVGPKAAGRTTSDGSSSTGESPNSTAHPTADIPHATNEQTRLLPDTAWHLAAMRDRDVTGHFRAQLLEAGRWQLHSAAAELKINAGVISVSPVSGGVGDYGKVAGALRVDVTHEVPDVSVDLKVTDFPLGKVGVGQTGAATGEAPPPGDPPEKRPPMIEGSLQVRAHLAGRGNSLHAFASKSHGKVTAVLTRGELRTSVAELAGLDLRGVGLKLSGDRAETEIRCGVASFEVKDGLATAQRLLLDTDPVLITGEGAIDLESEGLDLRLKGHPKRPRLRMRTPLLVHGPLKHPAFSVDSGKPAAQAAGAVALGVLLTPVAAMLAFVDPGLAKDTNCAALQADTADSSSEPK